MNKEKFQSIQPELERIGVKLTIEQAAELESIMAGCKKPILVVEEGHISYDPKRSDVLYTTLMELFIQNAQSKLAESLQHNILMVIMTLFALNKNPDEAIEEFVKAAKFYVEDFSKFIKEKGHVRAGMPINIKPSSVKS